MTDELVKRLLDIGSPLADEAAGVIHRLTVERDARIDPAHVQALVNAAEPALAEALAAAEAERDRLREALRDGRRLLAIAQDDRVRLLIQLEQCEKSHE